MKMNIYSPTFSKRPPYAVLIKEQKIQPSTKQTKDPCPDRANILVIKKE